MKFCSDHIRSKPLFRRFFFFVPFEINHPVHFFMTAANISAWPGTSLGVSATGTCDNLQQGDFSGVSEVISAYAITNSPSGSCSYGFKFFKLPYEFSGIFILIISAFRGSCCHSLLLLNIRIQINCFSFRYGNQRLFCNPGLRPTISPALVDLDLALLGNDNRIYIHDSNTIQNSSTAFLISSLLARVYLL